MEIVWAIFFIGAGNIQPVDTGYRFDSIVECDDFRDYMTTRRFDPKERYFKYDNSLDLNFTKYFNSLSIERQSEIANENNNIYRQYDCIPQKPSMFPW